MLKILILCRGNSCRSQMAHGFLQSFDNHLVVCSAGTQPTGKVDEKTIKIMAEIGIDISQHTSKNVDQYIDESWDYVITVCGGAQKTCPTFQGEVKHQLHIGFEDPSKIQGNEEFIHHEYGRIRDQIKKYFFEFYITEIKKQALPQCSCDGNC